MKCSSPVDAPNPMFITQTKNPNNHNKMLFASVENNQDSPLLPFRLITASSCSTNSPVQMGGYLLACGDSAK